MQDERYRDTSAVGGVPGLAEANIIDLGPQRKRGEEAEVDAAANAKGEGVRGGGGAGEAGGNVRATDQALNKGVDLGGITGRDARPKHVGKGVQRDASGRGVVAAEVADDAKEAVGVIGQGAAYTVLIDVSAAADVKIGIANGSVNFLSSRWDGEEHKS